MANEITTTTTTNDQQLYIAKKLLARSSLRLVCSSVCDKMELPEGHGTSARFVRYARMFVPLTALSEGVTPSTNSTFSLETVTVTLDQWGDVVTLTDVTMLATMHPVLQQAITLLADNAQRVIDREVQIVWLAGTNVTFGDASVTSRRTITAAMTMSDTIIHRARISLVDAGVPTRDGPSTADAHADDAKGNINGAGHYVAIAGPQVCGQIQTAGTSLGTWAAVAMYANQKALYNAEVGMWLGIRWVETNFIPKFTMLGGTTTAVVTANAFGTNTPVVTAVNGGGALKSGTTFFYKVTRKDKLRGFEEAISIAHSTASDATGGDDDSMTFNFTGLTAGFVYNLYFDTVAAGGTGTDATMKLVSANIAVGTTVTVTAVPSTGATPPDNVNTTLTPTIHPVYILGAEACVWAGLQNLRTYITKDEPSRDDPLNQLRKVGYKFMAKAAIKDQTRFLRVEVASSF